MAVPAFYLFHNERNGRTCLSLIPLREAYPYLLIFKCRFFEGYIVLINSILRGIGGKIQELFLRIINVRLYVNITNRPFNFVIVLPHFSSIENNFVANGFVRIISPLVKIYLILSYIDSFSIY